MVLRQSRSVISPTVSLGNDTTTTNAPQKAKHLALPILRRMLDLQIRNNPSKGY